MVREHRKWVLKSRAAGQLRGDVLSVKDIKRLSGSKEQGGKPSRLERREQEMPRAGLDQGPVVQEPRRHVAWSVRRSFVMGDLDHSC